MKMVGVSPISPQTFTLTVTWSMNTCQNDQIIQKVVFFINENKNRQIIISIMVQKCTWNTLNIPAYNTGKSTLGEECFVGVSIWGSPTGMCIYIVSWHWPWRRCFGNAVLLVLLWKLWSSFSSIFPMYNGAQADLFGVEAVYVWQLPILHSSLLRSDCFLLIYFDSLPLAGNQILFWQTFPDLPTVRSTPNVCVCVCVCVCTTSHCTTNIYNIL